jgi:hypothetical protein
MIGRWRVSAAEMERSDSTNKKEKKSSGLATAVITGSNFHNMPIQAETEADRLFAKAFHKYGSPLCLPAMPPGKTCAMVEIKSLFELGLLIHVGGIGRHGFVHFNYLQNDTFNALANILDGHEFITVFTGTVDRVYRLCYAFLCDPFTLPLIGNVGRQNLSTNIIDAIRSDYLPVLPEPPIDEIRLNAARNLAITMCLLILNHEVGHIAWCHVRLLQDKWGLNVHEEIPHMFSLEVDSLRRALEWEADEHAGICTYTFLCALRDAQGSIGPLSVDYLISAASLMLFLYNCKHTGGNFDAETRSHPAALDRWMSMGFEIDRSKICQKESKRKINLQLAHDDVWEFWKRNKLTEEVTLSTKSKRTLVLQMQRRRATAHEMLQCELTGRQEMLVKRQEYARNWHRSQRVQLQKLVREHLSGRTSIDFHHWL